MYKTTVQIEGMSCGMCEAHINDVIRKVFPKARKVKSSHAKNIAVFETEEPIDPSLLKKEIEETGYHYISADTVQKEKKKGLFRH